MQREFFIKNMAPIIICTFFYSCANYSGIKPLEHRVQRHPSQVIKAYKEESQKRDLDNIIAEKEEEKPDFLMRIKNKHFKIWVNYFTGKGKERYERYLVNGEKYRQLIEDILDDYGLPRELYFVGLIESGYYIKAKSHANAVGPWQFIRSTAKRYGLHINRAVDERQNIVKATKAAALFFQDLYNIFGSWELALSAYNAGEYGIIRRIRHADTRDYYELSRQKKLPKETINYVPKVLAAMHVYQQAKRYDINIPKYDHNIYNQIDEIQLDKPLSLEKISRATLIPLKTLKTLNPDLSWAHTPYLKKGFNLIVPNDKKGLERLERYAQTAKSYVSKNTKRVKSKKILRDHYFYKVKKGDNLYSLARKNHTKISKILKLNQLSKRTIYAGQVIKMPLADVSIYTVKRGDYLLKIAKQHNLTIKKLKKINGIQHSRIYPGQRLVVSAD